MLRVVGLKVKSILVKEVRACRLSSRDNHLELDGARPRACVPLVALDEVRHKEGEVEMGQKKGADPGLWTMVKKQNFVWRGSWL